MKVQSILWGFGAAFALLALFFGFCILWLMAPFQMDVNLSIVFLVLMVLAPLFGGGVAGILAGKNGMLHGFYAAMLSWAFCMLILIWFVPQSYSLPVLGISFVVFSFLGMAGGISGVNMRRLRRELKYAKKEPKIKRDKLYKNKLYKTRYKTRYKGFGKFNKL